MTMAITVTAMTMTRTLAIAMPKATKTSALLQRYMVRVSVLW